MQKFMQTVKSNAIVQAILFILLGAFLTIWPTTSAITLVYILAAGIALMGISSIVTYMRQKKQRIENQGTLVVGILLLLIALVVFIFPEAVAGLFTLVFGIILVLVGLINVFQSVGLRKFGGSAWAVMLIISLLLVVGGIVIIVNPFEAAVTAILVLGLLLLATGIIDLVIYFLASREKKLYS